MCVTRDDGHADDAVTPSLVNDDFSTDAFEECGIGALCMCVVFPHLALLRVSLKATQCKVATGKKMAPCGTATVNSLQ
jgi:hypothetical protein